MPTTINGTTGVSLVQDNTITSAKIVDGSVTPADTQVGALPSMVRLDTASVYGTTNTFIPRFTNIRVNQGSDITYADSVTLGASFTVNTNGVYSFTYTGQNAATATIGLSLNSANPTLSITSVPITEVLCIFSCAASFAGVACWTGYLPAGSIVRPHTTGGALSTYNEFTAVRVA